MASAEEIWVYLSAVHVRFFRSFNFDYLRKTDTRIKVLPWETTPEGQLYPYVTVPLERDITTVVGGNESGKSQLLLALKCALTGEKIRRRDFCRYSSLFAVDKGMRYPDFGVRLAELSEPEQAALRGAAGLAPDVSLAECHIFFVGREQMTIYARAGDDWQGSPVADPAPVFGLLPNYFEIDSKIPLPDAVPIQYLATGTLDSSASRRQRRTGIKALLTSSTSAEVLAAAVPGIAAALAPTPTADHDLQQLELAATLLLTVAKIDRSAFVELQDALDNDKQGYADGIVDRINRDLAKALNFPHWWSQDANFELRIGLRDFDLVFLIRDRTGTSYSFDERSGGLKYFLSYFVQYLSYRPKTEQPEILLMDEPDERLSSLGQQDMLRIFQAFAHPENPVRRACQVLYVTHSPFLIDKNHGQRIRVLEKGSGDEGTRVVRDVARNHYEPLRSAFGGFVAETTFIGHVNLFLEGQADQILIAGVSAHLTRLGTSKIENVDLNQLTLVPAGGCSQIPYLVYLARGRDVEKPAVVVLLDSDQSGNEAAKELIRKIKGRPRLMNPDYIFQMGDLDASGLTIASPNGVRELEDLVPAKIALVAARHYVAQRFGDAAAEKLKAMTPEDLSFTSPEAGLFDALESAVADSLKVPFKLDKVGLARGVLDALLDADDLDRTTMETNFRLLFTELGRRQRDAARDMQRIRTDARIKRARDNFLRDHPARGTREEAALLLEEILANIDRTEEGELLHTRVRQLIIKHQLEDDLTSDIADFPGFRDALNELAYEQLRDSQEPVENVDSVDGASAPQQEPSERP